MDSVNTKLSLKEKNLQNMLYELGRVASQNIAAKENKLNSQQNLLNTHIQQKMTFLEKSLEIQKTFLQSVDPKAWLKKGWTQIYDLQNNIVKSIKALKEDKQFKATLEDGTVYFKIERKELHDKK